MCPTLSDNRHTCLVETDGEPDDLYALGLAAKDEKFIEMCGTDLHISVMWPYQKKLATLRLIFHFLQARHLHIYEGATSKMNKLTNLPDHNLEIKQGETEASRAITKLLSDRKSIYILIIGPCTALARGMRNNADNKVPFQKHVKDIFWLGGFKLKDEQHMTSYNWYRDIKATEYILKDEKLAHKITIVMSRESHIYNPGLTPNKFRPFYEKLAHLEDDKVIREVNSARREWMGPFMKSENEKIKDISLGLKQELADEADKTQNVCAADIVAALVMFHPNLVKEMKVIEYELETTKVEMKAEEDKKKVWDDTNAKIIASNPIQNHEKFTISSDDLRSGVYKNKFITEINDIEIDYSKANTQPKSDLSPKKGKGVDANFKTFVLHLLDQYSAKNSGPESTS